MRADTLRIGTGFDVHPLRRGRRLLLGGEPIPFSHGLGGHSDADVLLHAICDALLGAAAQGDIGRHFPDDDPAYRDISSLELLRRVLKIIGRLGLRVVQIDSCVLAEVPKLSPYYPSHAAQHCPMPEDPRELRRHQGLDHRGLGLHWPRRGDRSPGGLPFGSCSRRKS